MIKEHNGCIIADVVGLGKSVIASMIARQMNKRGIIICPPGLMGDAEKKDSGWWEYLEKFGLHNWQVYSRGIVDRIADNIEGRDLDRKSTRLNSSHVRISYAVFCLKK